MAQQLKFLVCGTTAGAADSKISPSLSNRIGIVRFELEPNLEA